MLPFINATGNLAADAVLGYANNGTPVLNGTIYCNGNANGDPKHSEKVKFAVWGKPAEALSPILKKGMPITVAGQAIVEPYKTRETGEPAANFKILRAEVGLINTGNGNGAAAAADGEAPMVIANGAAPAAPAAMSVPSGDPMANGLPPVMSQPPF